MEGPKRVGVSTGQPLKREEQRQPMVVNAIPIEKVEGGQLRRYSLGRELVRVKFDVNDRGQVYVAGDTKTVRISLSHTPTGMHFDILNYDTITVGGNIPPIVWGVDRSAWTGSAIKVACNLGGSRDVTPAEPAPGVEAELLVY